MVFLFINKIENLNYDFNCRWNRVCWPLPVNLFKRAEYRQMINDIYTNNLPSEIQLPSNYQKWRFNVKVNPLLKQPIINRLFHEGLFASSHYHSANILFDDELFPNSNKLFDEIINLFNDYNYTKAMAMKTCKIINSVLSGGKYDLSITKLTPFNTNAA